MTIQTKTVETYDWMEDIEPILLENLNKILAQHGFEPARDLHGGAFKDGKWVGISDSKDYRNYWHVYIDLWGDKLHNDSYQKEYFPNVDDDEEWDYLYERADKFANNRYNGHEHTDPHWARHIVTSVRKMLREHFTPNDVFGDGYKLTFWWSW